MRIHRQFLAMLGLFALLPLAGCGAGLIGAAAAGGGGGGSAPPPPALSLPEARFPLVPASESGTLLRSVVIANAQIPNNAALRVELRAAGAVDEQLLPNASGQGTSTVVTFLMNTANIAAAVGDPTAADVTGGLAVLVDGREIATPVTVLLLRQPVATLEPPAGAELFLSPLGTTRMRCRVDGLRTLQAAELAVLVNRDDPEGDPAGETRRCSNVVLTALAGTEVQVEADVPGNTFAGQARLVVEDPIAGRSTVMANAYYRPDIAAALPRQGPTTGGRLVTLIGTALVPLDFSTVPARPDFANIRLSFDKGGRTVELDQRNLRTAESGLDRLVFVMPPSPDGRPGQVDIVLSAQLGSVQAQVVAADVFLFANPQPVFGPRGAALDRIPVDAAVAQLEGAGSSSDAPDLALVYDIGGVPAVQTLLAEENGMFIRGGPTRQIGEPAQQSERDPFGLAAGDFDADGVPDLFLGNRGGLTATHQLVRGQLAPDPLLGANLPWPGNRSLTKKALTADLDGDGRRDLVLVPGDTAPAGSLPQVFLSRWTAAGMSWLAVPDLPVRPGAIDAVEIVDLDGDLHLDVLVLTGGLTPRLEVAYGLGDGTFTAGTPLDFDIPNFDEHAGARAVGVHAVGATAPFAVAAVVSGLVSQPTTPSLVALLRPSGPRAYAPPVAADHALAPSIMFAASLAADLDVDGLRELVVAAAGDSAPISLAVLEWNPPGQLQFVVDGVEIGAERLLSIRSLHFGIAFPAAPAIGRSEVRSVFVVHESVSDGVREARVSTLLVGPNGTLRAPDAGGQVAIQIEACVGASVSPISVRTAGSTRDVIIAAPGEVRVLTNDGAGGFFSPGPVLPAPSILTRTLARIEVTPAPVGEDALAWCTTDGRIAVWRPNAGEQSSSADLRALAGGVLATVPLASGCRLLGGDVDGDGIADLTALLDFDLPAPGEGDSLLLFLRGKATLLPGEFPFHEPLAGAALATHGNTSSIAIGDFVQGGPHELVLAVPIGSSPGHANGDHLRFCRLVAGSGPGTDRFVASSDPNGPSVLLAGSAPRLVVAADFDRNGLDDVLVACEGDASLRFLRNDGLPASLPDEVNLAAFAESTASPWPAAPGQPTRLLLGDINGDGNVDALLATEQIVNQVRGTSVGYYLSSGSGEFVGPLFVSQSRLGNQTAELALDLGDFNGDGVPDLPVAWATVTDPRNVRVLFGGSR